MKIKGIVFDMDGLMVDSEPVQLKAINDALKPLGIVVKEPEFIDMVGRKAIENFRSLKEQYNYNESPEEVELRKNSAYLHRIRTELRVMPGLHQVIDMCRHEQLSMSIASSSPRKDILEVLKIIGMEKQFKIIASGDQVTQGKPAPDIFIKVAEMMDCPPRSLLVLEDAGHGVKAAKAAGMYCIAVPNRYTIHQDFSGADLVLESLEQLDIETIRSLVS